MFQTAASGRTNTSLRSMDVGLTTAVFGSKTQTAIAKKNSDLQQQTNAETKIDPSRRKEDSCAKHERSINTRELEIEVC